MHKMHAKSYGDAELMHFLVVIRPLNRFLCGKNAYKIVCGCRTYAFYGGHMVWLFTLYRKNAFKIAKNEAFLKKVSSFLVVIKTPFFHFLEFSRPVLA